LIFALVMNALSGTGFFEGRTVGEVSAMFENPFTPAGYVFAIWGLIYLLLIAFVVHQWMAWSKGKEEPELRQTGPWFAIANLASGFWILAWLNMHIGLSLVIIFVLLLSLITLTVRLKLELWDAPLRIIAFVWWPVTVYLGWIVVAVVANVTVYLTSIGWEGGFLTEGSWTILVIGVGTIIYLLLVNFRNMREAAIVGIWAFIGIAVRHWDANPAIAWMAIAASLVLLISAGSHAYKNLATLPFVRKWYDRE
ncbi:MAG: hypothetical protein ACOC30_03275, partial [Marinilabilia sp.]